MCLCSSLCVVRYIWPLIKGEPMQKSHVLADAMDVSEIQFASAVDGFIIMIYTSISCVSV